MPLYKLSSTQEVNANNLSKISTTQSVGGILYKISTTQWVQNMYKLSTTQSIQNILKILTIQELHITQKRKRTLQSVGITDWSTEGNEDITPTIIIRTKN